MHFSTHYITRPISNKSLVEVEITATGIGMTSGTLDAREARELALKMLDIANELLQNFQEND